MKTNMNPMDAAIRSGVGLFLISSPLLNLHTYPYNLLGIVPLATALVGVCPLYSAVNFVRSAVGLGSKPVHGHG